MLKSPSLANDPAVVPLFFLSQLKLEDRSIVIRDIVRRNNSADNQCGIVTNIDIECAVKFVGTNCVLYPVNSKDLQHIWSFMYGDYIAYDFWLGKVYDLTNHIILKLSNGARCSMSVEDGAKLYDVCPHVSDSVCSWELFCRLRVYLLFIILSLSC
ncbi:E2/E3 hybrid ubiquitin-protein ligase ube2o [Xenoophorus captivus]|uniref:E2/E3 hybrid ubiquitin-protein ligase ube2o n=1 Tax=Xenoophorus captivus TaxID=1517983 RepID=A0ABV0RR81_9TELE